MTFEEGVKKILDGNAILFTGSGFSLGATNVQGQDIPMSADVARKMCTSCGLAESDDIGSASEYFMAKKGAGALVEFLKNEFTVSSRITSEQRLIATLPWKRYYTTNYDGIVEKAVNELGDGRRLTPVSLSDDPRNYRNKEKVVVHLNGSIDGLLPSHLSNSFRLTNSSYLAADEFKKSQWMSLFMSDLHVCDAIFFVGFSLKYDLDIKRIIHQAGIRDKAFFVVWSGENELDRFALSNYGTVLPINVEGLANEIQRVKRGYTPQTDIPLSILSFQRMRIGWEVPTVRDADFHELIRTGRVIEEALAHEQKAPNALNYTIYRNKIKGIVSLIDGGESNIVVTSLLGNGKTIFLKGLGYTLSAKGYKVYYLVESGPNVEKEVESICTTDDNAVFIIDDYHANRDVVETICQYRTNQTVIISERTYIFDIIFDEVGELLGSHAYCDINQLDDGEIETLDQLMLSHSLWGKTSTQDKTERKRYIVNKCNRELGKVILGKVEDSDIAKRYKSLVDSLRGNPKIFSTLKVLLINETYGLHLSFDDLVDIIGADTFNNPAFRNNEQVRELLDVERERIIFRSSVMATLILRKMVLPSDVVNTLIEMAQSLEIRQGSNRRIRLIYQNLMTFRSMQRSLDMGHPSAKSEIFRFYETIKGYTFCQNRIHFWLQYAIARLTNHDLELASRYFDRCYSLADEISGYDKYKIDNHYCRYLLENELDSGQPDTCMAAFERAHSMLIAPSTSNDNRHYTFKVAELYGPFYHKFYAQMSPSDQAAFVRSCKEILALCERFSGTEDVTMKKHMLRAKKSISECVK